MKTTILRIAVALIMAMTLVVGSAGAASAARNPAFIQISGHPVAGDLKFYVGCRNSSTAIRSYGVAICNVSDSTWIDGITWVDLSAGTHTFESDLIVYTTITAPAKYAIDLFFKLGDDGPILFFKSKDFKIR